MLPGHQHAVAFPVPAAFYGRISPVYLDRTGLGLSRPAGAWHQPLGGQPDSGNLHHCGVRPTI